MALRLFLDSADPEAWQAWLPTGLFHGVTTNPSLLRRAGQPCDISHLGDLTRQASSLGCRELHLQAWGGDARQYAQCGRQLAALAPELVWVKLPITAAGSRAAVELIAAGLRVTFTACYQVSQVLAAAALAADYIAPYLGRIAAQGRDAHAELIAMQRCLEGCGSSTRLLVASLRCCDDLSRLAAAGLSTFTISPALASELFSDPATAAAAEQFESDARWQLALPGP
ncbi:MAG: transaldolase family protein [Prochlorococcaceae cyanobacterium]